MKVLKAGMLLAGLTFATMAFGQAVDAHGVWLAPRLDKTQLVLGEGPKDNAYQPSNVLSVEGFTNQYKPINVPVVEAGDHIYVEPSEKVAVAVINFDYGYWTKGPDGKVVNKPMNEVPGAKVGTHAIKYSVNYLQNVTKPEPIPGLPYQIVPLKDPTKLQVGDILPVLVLHDNTPMAMTEIFPDLTNHHTVTIKTDEQGVAYVPVANGATNVIGLELVEPLPKNDPLATRNKIFSSLSYTLYPEED